MNNTVTDLLKETTQVIKEQQLTQTQGLNIFNVCGISTNEVLMCKFLKELLDPDGKHGCGDIFINSFMKDVLKIEGKKPTAVHREYAIPLSEYADLSKDRRIDIVIECDDCWIPIEAKIFARDQYHQCVDYLIYAREKNNGDKWTLYYLTIDGSIPNKKSTYGLSSEDEKHIKPISWEEITKWIKKIIKHEKIKEKTALVECLKQYYSAIESFIKNEREKKSMMGLILKDKETLKAATEISNTYLNIAKTEALRALFENIKEKLNTKNNSEFKLLEVDNGTEDVDDFYRRGKTYPNVTYLFKNSLVQPIIGDDFEVAVRLEIDPNIFVGICFPYRYCGKYINNKLPNGWKESKPAGFILEEIKNYKDKSEKNNPDDNNWWYGWKYIKIDNETINFKKADSDIYYDIIFNESKRNDFLEECNNVFNYFCTLVKNAFKKVDHSE